MKQVILALRNGKKTSVNSYSVKNSKGLFAIHRPFEGTDTSWDITHIPSGKRIARDIGDIKEARRVGAYIVTLLNDMHDMRYIAWQAFESADPNKVLPKPVFKALGNAIAIGRDGATFEADGRRALVKALVDHSWRAGAVTA